MFKESTLIEKNKYNFLAIFDYIFFSLSNVFMKMASLKDVMFEKLLWYGLSMLCLFIFSILWQILLKNMPLNKAYLYKGTTLFWGILFGVLIFNEKIKINMIIGVLIVLFGIFYAFRGDKNE